MGLYWEIDAHHNRGGVCKTNLGRNTMRIVGWLLTADEQCENCFECPASVTVMTDDELTTKNLCKKCIPPGVKDPILEIFSKVLGA